MKRSVISYLAERSRYVGNKLSVLTSFASERLFEISRKESRAKLPY